MADKKKIACGTGNTTSESENNFTSIIDQAKEKIKSCKANNLKDRKAKVIFKPVIAMLSEFCSQQEEFARAVLDADVEKIIDKVGKGLGNAVSDFEVYQQIVSEIFDGAVVKFKMAILMSKYDEESALDPPQAPMVTEQLDLSLDGLMDW